MRESLYLAATMAPKTIVTTLQIKRLENVFLRKQKNKQEAEEKQKQTSCNTTNQF